MVSRGNLVSNLFIVWAGHFICDMMIGFWSIYKTLASIDVAVAGLILGICATLGEGGQLFFGPLSDRGYRKPLLIVSVLLLCAATLLPFAEELASWLPYIEPLWLSALFLGLSYIGSGMFHPAASGLAGSLSLHKKGLYASLFYSGGALGMSLSHMAFAYSYESMALKSTVFAIPAVALLLFVFLTPVPERVQDPMKPKRNVWHIFSFFKMRDMRVLYFCLVCNQALFWGTVFILPDFLQARHFESWLCYGGGHMAFLLGGGLMMVPSGYLADRFSARVVILIATVGSLFCYNLFIFTPFLSATAAASLLFIMGAANGVVSPLGLGLGTRLVPDHPGAASAFLLGGVWAIAEFVGPAGAGFLASSFEVSGYAKALGMMGVLNLAVFYLAWHLPTPARVQQSMNAL